MEVKLNPGEAYYSMDHASSHATQLLEELLAALNNKIVRMFPSAELMESFGTRVAYKISREDEVVLSKVFTALEEGRIDCLWVLEAAQC